LEAGLAALHAHHVGQRDLKLEHLLAGHHPLPGRDGRGQAVEQRRLALRRLALRRPAPVEALSRGTYRRSSRHDRTLHGRFTSFKVGE
ncbi:MAG: hypothetical protein ABJA81_01530, partial [Nocardioidaceae bacterium]